MVIAFGIVVVINYMCQLTSYPGAKEIKCLNNIVLSQINMTFDCKTPRRMVAEAKGQPI